MPAKKDISEVPCIQYIPNSIPREIGKNIFSSIMKEVVFISDEMSSIVVMGKKVKIRRKQSAYGDKGLMYRFSGVSVEAKPWEESPILSTIRDFVHENYKIPVNFVLVNLYRDGNDYIGYHSDDETDLDPKYPIVSFSFGAKRTFLLQDKRTKIIYEKDVENNSCILMKHPCQSLYKHSVPKRKKVKMPRINITFRVIQKKN